jgi:hypothetical protein
LCGCEAWPLTLREEHRLRAFENRLLRKIFRPKSEEVIGQWERLHTEKLYVIPAMESRRPWAYRFSVGET